MELTSHYQDSPPCPAYTVAASKHTSENQNKKTIPAFKSATLTKQTSPPPAPTYSNNFLRLGPIKKDALESLNLTQLININNKKLRLIWSKQTPKKIQGKLSQSKSGWSINTHLSTWLFTLQQQDRPRFWENPARNGFLSWLQIWPYTTLFTQCTSNSDVCPPNMPISSWSGHRNESTRHDSSTIICEINQ